MGVFKYVTILLHMLGKIIGGNHFKNKKLPSFSKEKDFITTVEGLLYTQKLRRRSSHSVFDCMRIRIFLQK